MDGQRTFLLPTLATRVSPYPKNGFEEKHFQAKRVEDEIVVFAGLQISRKNPALVGTSQQSYVRETITTAGVGASRNAKSGAVAPSGEVNFRFG